MSTQKSLRSRFIRAFPIPKYLAMPAAAMSISGGAVHFLFGARHQSGLIPLVHDEAELPTGTTHCGEILGIDALANAVNVLAHRQKARFIHLAVPESALYLYTLYIQGHPNKRSIAQQIEFSFDEHVPMPLSDSIYDFDIVEQGKNMTLVSVSAVASSLIAEYQEVVESAGLGLLSIESEASSYARALSQADNTTHMIVAIDEHKATIVIAKNKLPLYATTVLGGTKAVPDVIAECTEQYNFWDTRTAINGKRIERIGTVIVCGNGASDEFIQTLTKSLGDDVAIHTAGVWQNLFNQEKYIPKIHANDAQGLCVLSGLLIKNNI